MAIPNPNVAIARYGPSSLRAGNPNIKPKNAAVRVPKKMEGEFWS